MSEIDRVREQLRQHAAARLADLGPAARPVESAEARLGVRFTPGARVFDRVTGEVGEVVSGSRENIVVSTPRSTDR